MVTIAGYKINKKIIDEDGIVVYCGQQPEGQSVLIKTLKADTANLTDAARLLHEFQICGELKVEAIIRPLRLKRVDGIPVIIMEDTGLVPLLQKIEAPLSHLPSIFSLTTQLVEILQELYRQEIVHGNLQPANIFIESGTKEIKMTGFTMATKLNDENQDTINFASPQAALPYVSPEQTGTLNRAVDYRSDYYSLGIVLYQIMTGSLPFQVENPAEWRHAHITRKPVPPREINPELPRIFAEIILKLIAKDPEERYQSAGGLLRDLKKCRRRWQSTGEIPSFPLGRMDLPGCIINHTKLYGRDEEKEILRDTLDEVCSGESAFVFIHGYTGVGKTALVEEIVKPAAIKHGYYIYGKFDHLQSRRPYAPIIKAFTGLIRQLLTESQEELQKWKKRFDDALGDNGAVLVEVIPDIELLIGPQPPVEELSPRENQTRFRLIFRNFLRVFAKMKQPLVVFIDDLQWVDRNSLQLIKYLARHQDSGYLLFIGAYRDNEVKETGLLKKSLQEIQQTDIKVQNIALKALNLYDTGRYVTGILSATENKVQSLTRVLFKKTAGNPFFLKQLLLKIHKDNLISYNSEKECWEWDLSSLNSLEIATDVFQMMTNKLKVLPERTSHFLKIAACVGNNFVSSILTGVHEDKNVQAVSGLQPAVLEGLILPRPDSGNSLQQYQSKEYQFLHDSVRQAAYSLLNKQQKKEIHLNIGRLLLENMDEEDLTEEISGIMDQLNRGLDLIKTAEERIKYARYNLLAGRKARNTTAYDSALSYLRSGTELLPGNCWDEHYKLSYDLYLARSQCEYLCGNLEQAEYFFNLILNNCRTDMEEARVYEMKMILNSGVGKHYQAVHYGIAALKKIGYKLPVNPGKIVFIKEIILFKWRMYGKDINELLHLPEMDKPVPRKAMEIIAKMAPSANSVTPELFALLCLKGANISIKYGNSDLSAIGYAAYAIILSQVLGDYVKAYRFGELAIRLAEKYNNSSAKSIVYFIVGGMVIPWAEHGRTGVDYLRKAVKYSTDSGELTYTCYALQCLIEYRLILGDNLDDILKEYKKWYKYARRLQLDHLLADIILYRQLVNKLKGSTDNPETGEFDDKFLQKMNNDDNKILNTTYTCSRLIAAYFSGNHEEALTLADSIKKTIHSIEGFMLHAEYIFYYSLTITASYHHLQQKRYYRKILKKNQRQLKKWSDICAENYLHKYLLVAAEQARLNEEHSRAISLYDRAIKSARENGYKQNEALGAELAARYFHSRGQEKIAAVYMIDAYYGYYNWGAVKKSEKLREEYPQLLNDYLERKESSASGGNFKNDFLVDTLRNSDPVKKAGLEDINRAGENSQNKALDYLKVAMESAGADRGYLIMEKDGELFIDAARGDVKIEDMDNPVMLNDYDKISISVVRYVARTSETVVINDSDKTDIIPGADKLKQYQHRSVLCLPVLMQGIPVGVLYLENTLMSGLFTQDSLDFLRLLSSHMVYVRKLEYLLNEDNGGEKEVKREQELVEPLTERELGVMELIAAGMSNKEIAQELYLSINTIKMHIKNIYGKLEVNRRIQAVNKARNLNII